MFPFNDWGIAHFQTQQTTHDNHIHRGLTTLGGTQPEVEYNFGDLGITGVGLPSRTVVLRVSVATDQKTAGDVLQNPGII